MSTDRTDRNVIVSYRGIAAAVEGLRDSVQAAGPARGVAAATALRRAPVGGADLGEEAGFELELAGALAALRREDEAADPDVMTSPRNQLAALLMTAIARDELPGADYEPAEAGGLELREVKFDKGDWWGWFKDWWGWVVDRDNFHPILRPGNAVAEPLPDKARVALFSDWGTGLYGAPELAKTIRDDADSLDLILHLGDIYYSGGVDEVQDRCLSHWPDPRPERGRGRALNANHEMYAGGHGYFGKLLPALGQPSSYFAYQNDHWTLIGLDTAWVDHDLDPKQLSWIDQVLRAAGPDRRVLLFSHHQIFSRLEDQGVKLARRLGSHLRQGRFAGWYWGHEHRCFIHDPHERFGGLLGRCLGHGGIPYKRYDGDGATEERREGNSRWLRFGPRDLVPGGLLLDGPNPHVEGKEDKYGPHGYMTLELDGPSLIERVHDVDGKVLLELVN